MKSLGNLLSGITGFEFKGPVDKTIDGFEFDSRLAKKGIVFVARKGIHLDGHDFIESAIHQGSEVIICEQFPSNCYETVCYIKANSLPELLGEMMHKFYDFQLKGIQLVGVTGTNGKTTVASLLFQLFSKLGYKCGLLSTVENIIIDEIIPATHTTPDQIKLYELLNKMVQKQVTYVFMEVSSHALDQGRVAGLNFSAGLFTNITHDHLDYHKTFKAYLEAKKSFFDLLPANSFAIINADDPNGRVMVQNTKAKIVTYSLSSMSDYKARILENGFDGLHLKFNDKEWNARLVGEFNAYNLLCVYACALEFGFESEEILLKMSELYAPQGRLDWVRNQQSGKIGIVDYAHTPDALEKILKTVKSIRKPFQKIITVVGCGGDRDTEKRPQMGRIASVESDLLILTSDNPRSEDPDQIIKQMEAGIPENRKMNYLIIEDRSQAIKTACSLSALDDIILVAGKGHENYQEIKGKKFAFDDKQILKTYLLNL
ncbi:MAG TPA: UDP-N-acetylmuramoyl-L-alanyl-D-glutamate--2,6-diaminopimelate ligase [Saprospiraceae bacterium]|nr:UDP-N-acetylmuramoyl-L-alanyl-D-glutamate--2,6-diaminopimelate ligase [Saprospiraceae bacterium]